MSTTFFVFQAQRDLAQARTVEIQAIADYNKSLVDFEAVQSAPPPDRAPGHRSHWTAPGQPFSREVARSFAVSTRGTRGGPSCQWRRRPPPAAPPALLPFLPTAVLPFLPFLPLGYTPPRAEALGHGHHQERSDDIGDALKSVAWADELVVVDSE